MKFMFATNDVVKEIIEEASKYNLLQQVPENICDKWWGSFFSCAIS